MNRLLLYVHFNKYNQFSEHVRYQLTQLRQLFSKVVFISNSQLDKSVAEQLKNDGLIDQFIQRQNQGYDFAAWHEGMSNIGFDNLTNYDSITAMNDTCFGPLWDMTPYFEKYEADDSVDFWGMTNHRAIDAGHIFIDEHLQSYFMSYKKCLIESSTFQDFWKNVESYKDVQKVIDNYETKYTKIFREAGFNYQAVLNTVPIADQFYHSNFTIHYPHVLLDNKVPFIKIKTFDLTQHLSPYLLTAIEEVSEYPVQLILDHMSDISQPTPAYLMDRKVLSKSASTYSGNKKVAIHLHTFYVDLLEDFLKQFSQLPFKFDLILTTDTEQKKIEIEQILDQHGFTGKIFITGNKGRDIIPMLKLKEELKAYDYIGHFHTKKSPEYPYWVGDSWRNELFQMLLNNADKILGEFEHRDNLGLAIADIPSFFRYTKIVDPVNENRFADDMNNLWKKMSLERSIDFNKISTFIMSYGTFIWFKRESLQ
ncbi:rhamnan synthesis F family protein, partial [Streptococcus sobrinus]